MPNFKYLNKGRAVFDAEEAEDVQASQKQLVAQLRYYQVQLDKLPQNANVANRIDYLLHIARIQIERYQGKDAWNKAFSAFSLATENALWEQAVVACDALFLSEGPDALVALGHALWLGTIFPIDPELSVAVLQHLVEESPLESETKAIAATTAHYIAELRAGKDSDLSLFTNQLLASVADEHSHISDQMGFDVWRRALSLDNPDVFLPKLSGAIDQLVGGKWWINKAKIQRDLAQKHEASPKTK